MRRLERSIELDAAVDQDGKVLLPADIIRRLQAPAGSKLRVRLTMNSLLSKRGIDEEEVDRIGRLQLEDRDRVIQFLAAEGRLAKNKRFARRAKGISD